MAEKAGSNFRLLALGFGVSGAAMFAEPTVTEVEEVVGLIHGEQKTEFRSQESGDRIQEGGVAPSPG